MAGSFYPADPEELKRDVDAFLANVSPAPGGVRPLALIEPHAGYMYSGQIAAHGYKLLAGHNIRTVIIVSPSHMEYFPYAAVYDGDAYETPLGKIPVDKTTARRLVEAADRIQASDKGHTQEHLPRREHALEVQLPFLQQVLSGFEIVPIVMGDQDWEMCEVLGGALGAVLAAGDAVAIASSDLSHFHSYDEATSLDGVFCDLVEAMDARSLFESVERRKCEACGAGPVIATMIAAQRAGATECRLLRRANSGDVSGDRGSVVGYLAAAFLAADAGDRASVLGAEEQARLLALARRAIEESLGHPAGEAVTFDGADREAGVFVTLRSRGRLRGCIGTIEPARPLREMVRDMSVAAATRDPRFQPVTREDLEGLVIEISVLSPLRAIDGPDAVVIGRDGLVVERDFQRGLLLPQVASEHGWDAVRFAEYTCDKAGLPPGAWQDDDTQLYAFTTTTFSE